MGIRVRDRNTLRQCKRCGRDIVWAMNPATGSWIPMDPLVHVYDHYEVKDPSTGRVVLHVNPAFDNAASDHRSTCPLGNHNRARKNPPHEESRNAEPAGNATTGGEVRSDTRAGTTSHG